MPVNDVALREDTALLGYLAGAGPVLICDLNVASGRVERARPCHELSEWVILLWEVAGAEAVVSAEQRVKLVTRGAGGTFPRDREKARDAGGGPDSVGVLAHEFVPQRPRDSL